MGRNSESVPVRKDWTAMRESAVSYHTIPALQYVYCWCFVVFKAQFLRLVVELVGYFFPVSLRYKLPLHNTLLPMTFQIAFSL
jgi:hypothetical protein